MIEPPARPAAGNTVILGVVHGSRKLRPAGSNYSCGAAIILQQSSEPLATRNGVAARFGFVARLRKKEFVTFPLGISFPVIMSAELGQGPRQRALAEQDQPRQVSTSTVKKSAPAITLM